jgi:hypothetical protein
MSEKVTWIFAVVIIMNETGRKPLIYKVAPWCSAVHRLVFLGLL